MRNFWFDGVMGVLIGDALGMPVQFLSREEIRENPVVGMLGYGTYHMPPGTWSDDGSMTLATLDSIREKDGIDYDDVMEKFLAWEFYGKYTQGGEAFDQGNTCTEAIYNYRKEHNYKTCGKTGEWANGNGALMRILPVCLYSYVEYKKGHITEEKALEYVHQVSSLTHNHLRSRMACGIYYFLCKAAVEEEGDLICKLQKGMNAAEEYYKKDRLNQMEWTKFESIYDLNEFRKCDEGSIKSSGYVVDSLEAAVWSLITTETFEDALLRAVNLGDDTDTVGAIAGGLAALHYGVEGIPKEWYEAIYDKEDVVEMCEQVGRMYY